MQAARTKKNNSAHMYSVVQLAHREIEKKAQALPELSSGFPDFVVIMWILKSLNYEHHYI